MISEDNQPVSAKKNLSLLKRISAFGGDSRLIWTVIALAIILLVDRIISPNFFEIRMVNDRLVGSLINILDSSAPYALLSMGMALVIATKGIDLSVGAVMAICAAVAVVLVKSYEGGATEFYVQPGAM